MIKYHIYIHFFNSTIIYIVCRFPENCYAYFQNYPYLYPAQLAKLIYNHRGVYVYIVTVVLDATYYEFALISYGTACMIHYYSVIYSCIGLHILYLPEYSRTFAVLFSLFL